MGGDLGLGPGEIGERGLDRALGRRPPHEVLQGEVDEGALARRRRRRLGEPLDVAEPERQRAARERAHRARRKRDRHRVRELARRVDRVLRRHAPTIPPGCATNGGPSRFRVMTAEPERYEMKVDTGVMAPSLSDIGPRARELEELGYDGLLTAETGHDAFLPIALAAEHTERIELAHGHRGRVRPHADGARVHGERPAADVEGPVRARPRLADQAAHREAVLDAVVAPGAAHARVRPRVAGDLERRGTTGRRSSSRASSTATR